MGPDEAGAPGDEIVSHIANVGPDAGPLYPTHLPRPAPGHQKTSQPADKPNPVRLRPRPHGLPALGATIIPLGPGLLAGSSDLPGGFGRAVRSALTSWPGEPGLVGMPLPPYLVLLRAGFCLPPPLPAARCALTAPFHPYLELSRRRYFFCATIRQIALPGRYPAHCPSEFGLSSRSRRWRRPLSLTRTESRRSSGRLRRFDYGRPCGPSRPFPG